MLFADNFVIPTLTNSVCVVLDFGRLYTMMKGLADKMKSSVPDIDLKGIDLMDSDLVDSYSFPDDVVDLIKEYQVFMSV